MLVNNCVVEFERRVASVCASAFEHANNLSNGNFGPIRIDGPGGAIHQESIMTGSETSVCGLSQPSCTDATVSTQTGNLIGPTSAGFEYVFANTSSDCDEFDEVLIPTDGDAYRIRGTCNPWSEDTSSLRLVLVPVIDSFCNGSCDVTILYFTAMFLNELGSCTGNECEVTGTFVSVIADPTSGAELGIYDEDSPIKFVRLVK